MQLLLWYVRSPPPALAHSDYVLSTALGPAIHHKGFKLLSFSFRSCGGRNLGAFVIFGRDIAPTSNKLGMTSFISTVPLLVSVTGHTLTLGRIKSRL